MKPFVKCCLSASVATLVACGGSAPNPGDNSSSVQSSSQPVSSTPVSSTPSSTPVSSTPSSSSSSQPSSGNERLVFAVNVGGGATTYNGVNYISDNDYFLSTGGTPHDTQDPIDGTTEDTLFQSEKYGEFSYEIPVTNASYRVVLHFVEMFNEASGDRSFNVSLEGTEVLSGLDIFSIAGHDYAHTEEFDNIIVNDESLTISLERIADQGTLSGIAIYSTTGNFIEPPEPEPLPPSAENPGAECSVASLPSANSLPSNPNLPDPFTKLDGTRITDKSEWRCRRQEIIKQAYKYIYGEKPYLGDGDSVTGTVTSSNVSVNVSANGRTASFSAGVSLPTQGSAPYPYVINFGGGFGASWIVSSLRNMGVAVVTLTPNDVGVDGNLGNGAFFSIYPNSNAGNLIAWAWGVSRIIDVVEQNSGILKADRVGVTGCSRFGKGAFAAGAFDNRINLVLPEESGIGGVPSLKLVPILEPNPSNSGTGPEQPPHATNNAWLSPSAFTLRNDTSRLPVDMHEVVGLVAPRGFYLMDNHGNLQNFLNLDIKSAYASIQAGKMIYEALDVGDSIGFVAASTSHCNGNSAYNSSLQAFVNKFLFDQNANTGEISPGPVQVNINNHIDWTTPNLTGELDLSVD